jgi:putative nucleotidyltransferase with HDIG domain
VTYSSGSLPLIEELARRAESGTLQLPVLPAVAAEVLACLDGEDCDARSLAALIQKDPSLAANLLRVANSARFAPKEPIVSLTQAIGRLGLSTLREIALTVAVKGAVFNVPGHEDYVAKLWRRAHASGRLAQEVARTRRSNVEAAFLCGLLHDIGAPVILQGLVDLARANRATLDAGAIENAVEALHATIGARLVQDWKLPDWVHEVTLNHHDPESASGHQDLVHTVALSDALTHWLLEDGGEGDAPGQEHLPLLDLYQDDFERLCEKGAEITQESAT